MGFFKPAGDDAISEADEVDDTDDDGDLTEIALDADDDGPDADGSPG